MSRGVHGGTANADWAGAIAMYFSKHGPTGPGIVASVETCPRQSIVSRFWLQYSLTSRSVPAAATPTGSWTVAKGLGLAAQKIPVRANNPAIVRVIFVLRGIFFIFGILRFADVVFK